MSDMKLEDLRVIRIMGFADGRSSPLDGQFVISWNSNTRLGILDVKTTPERRLATAFTVRDALHDWQRVSLVEPTRPDGRPNRPLTAFNIQLEMPVQKVLIVSTGTR